MGVARWVVGGEGERGEGVSGQQRGRESGIQGEREFYLKRFRGR
jgi:hypothetical protein